MGVFTGSGVRRSNTRMGDESGIWTVSDTALTGRHLSTHQAGDSGFTKGSDTVWEGRRLKAFTYESGGEMAIDTVRMGQLSSVTFAKRRSGSSKAGDTARTDRLSNSATGWGTGTATESR